MIWCFYEKIDNILGISSLSNTNMRMSNTLDLRNPQRGMGNWKTLENTEESTWSTSRGQNERTGQMQQIEVDTVLFNFSVGG